MKDLVFDDPCVLFALRREAQPFYREFRPQQRFPGAPCRARFCGPEWLTVLVVETGVGATAIEKALGWVVDKPVFGNLAYRPKLVLSAGFAGALREEQAVGDVILATEVVDTEGNCWATTWPGEWQPPLPRGRFLCSSHLVGDPEQKRRLGIQHDAIAVDMESAAVARLCTKHEIPFGCVRAISDAVHTPLSPELVGMLARGRVSPFGLISTLVKRPGVIAELWQLARNTRQAADQLAAVLGNLLTMTLPWGKDL
jgi:adenosylhomocysteine nucleosidase